MEKVSICHACGRTIDAAFIYCPWCGTFVARVNAVPDRVDVVCNKLEHMQQVYTADRLIKMANDLGELDEALSRIVPETPVIN